MDAHRRSELSNAESPQNDILALKESFRSARPETPNDPGWDRVLSELSMMIGICYSAPR